MIKVGVIVVLLAIGAFNWRWVRPSLGDDDGARRVQRSATVELIVAALVLAVTAVLLATPTPSAPQPDGRDRVALAWGRAGE
jgi:putative copper export protein